MSVLEAFCSEICLTTKDRQQYHIAVQTHAARGFGGECSVCVPLREVSFLEMVSLQIRPTDEGRQQDSRTVQKHAARGFRNKCAICVLLRDESAFEVFFLADTSSESYIRNCQQDHLVVQTHTAQGFRVVSSGSAQLGDTS